MYNFFGVNVKILFLRTKITHLSHFIWSLFQFYFLTSYRYPEARKHIRKVIFHAGPTNSGKTYHALERFISSRSGIYCGPLKLLATEVFKKTNERVSLRSFFISFSER